jgi:hypothetical protein
VTGATNGSQASKVRQQLEALRADADADKRVHEMVETLAAGELGKPIAIRYGAVEVQARMVVVSAADGWEAAAAAWRKLEAAGLRGSPEESLLYDRCELVELTARAIRDPETGARVFSSGDELAETLPDPVLVKLTREYTDLVEQIDQAGADEIAALVDALKKKEWMRLRSIAPTLPRDSLDTLVSLLLDCLAGRSSGTGSYPGSFPSSSPGETAHAGESASDESSNDAEG